MKKVTVFQVSQGLYRLRYQYLVGGKVRVREVETRNLFRSISSAYRKGYKIERLIILSI